MTYFPLRSHVKVKILSSKIRPIPKKCQAMVDAVWKEEELFDSHIVSLLSHSADQLVGELVEYRVWYACMRTPKLRKMLHIHPLCVSGRTIWKDCLLVGRRGRQVASMATLMELCPSGIVDKSCISPDGTVDIRQSILIELEEETGIAASYVQSVCPKGLYWSEEEGIWDIHMDIKIKKEAPIANLGPTKEYEELFWIKPEEIKKRFPQKQWVPLSLELLT